MRFQNGSNKVAIELSGVRFLVWNHTSDFKSNERCAVVRFWNTGLLSSFRPSFLRFLWTFSTSPDQYISVGSHLRPRRKLFIHQVICFWGNVPYTWIVSTRSTGCVLLAWSPHCYTSSVLSSASSALYDWPERTTRTQAAVITIKLIYGCKDGKGKTSRFILLDSIVREFSFTILSDTSDNLGL